MPESRSQPAWMLVLSYMAFLGFIPLLAGKQHRNVRWHAINGLLLFAAVAAFLIAATLIGFVVPSLTCVYVIVMLVVGVVYAIIAILAVVKALDGHRLIVPWISRYADRHA
jgi:uncharacterized membrane protein